MKKSLGCSFSMFLTSTILLASVLTPAAFPYRQLDTYAAQTPSREEQLGRFGNGILDLDAYGFVVNKAGTFGQGADQMLWRCSFSGGSKLLVDVKPTDPSSTGFWEQWEATTRQLGAAAQKELGGELKNISYEMGYADNGAPMPTVRANLKLDSSTRDYAMALTICYRFEETYTAEFIGINDSNDDTVEAATIEAAKSFTDFGGEAHLLNARPAAPLGHADWPYPYLHNPFAVASHYLHERTPLPPTAERQAGDYDVHFEAGVIEALVRGTLHKGDFDIPLRSSDLDFITYFNLAEHVETDYYNVTFNDMRSEIPRFNMSVTSVGDIKEFRNLTSLQLDLPHVTDLSPLAGAMKLKSLAILSGSENTNLDWLSPLTSLTQLLMWGEPHSNVTDITGLRSLQNMESLYLFVPSVADVSVLAELPNLKSVTLHCSPNADLQALINAPQIESLAVNGDLLKGFQPGNQGLGLKYIDVFIRGQEMVVTDTGN